MPIRNPTEVERKGLASLREEQIKASYERGLPVGVVWLVLALVLVGAAAIAIAFLD